MNQMKIQLHILHLPSGRSHDHRAGNCKYHCQDNTCISDDLLSTTFLACNKHKMICPAMNTQMYENPITQKNIQACKDLGYQILDPVTFHSHTDRIYDHPRESGHTSSRTVSPFSLRVDPVSTISTITSARPTIGASSIEPFSLMISTVWCLVL